MMVSFRPALRDYTGSPDAHKTLYASLVAGSAPGGGRVAVIGGFGLRKPIAGTTVRGAGVAAAGEG
jgi:hypothetical protein